MNEFAPVAQDPLDLLLWQFLDLASSRGFNHVSKVVRERVTYRRLDPSWAVVIESIAMVEMSQRPLILRACERTISYPLMLVRPSRLMTLGPLQIKGAPLSLSKAVDMAFMILEARGLRGQIAVGDLMEVADVWNGSVIQESGTRLSYLEALRGAWHMVTNLRP